MKSLVTLFAISALSAGNFSCPHTSAPFVSNAGAPIPPNYHENAVASRLQWESNFGYCGEVCYIAAGLYYGQYCSQYTARSLASPGVPQNQSGSQLLLGQPNAATAATAMKLRISAFDTASQTSTNEFLVWLKAQINAGYPVAMTLFENQYLFYGDTDPDAGDDTYDHIATAYAVGSYNSLGDPSYFADDRFYITDLGLYTPGGAPIYFFDYAFGQCQLSRAQANSKRSPPYSLNSNYQVASDGGNYGTAFLGIVDTDSNTIPVRITTNFNYERPTIVDGSDAQPAPMALTLTVTVTIADQSKAYNVYYYTDFGSIPTANFNSSGTPVALVIPPGYGPTYTFTKDIQSNQIAAYRVVATTAP